MIRTSLLVTAMLLMSCGQAANDPGANDAATATPAAPAPVQSPPVAAETPGVPQLTAQGWSPLRIGMTLAEITTALGPDADPGAVGGPDPAICDQFRPARAPADMLVMVERGVLTHVALTGRSDIFTDRAIAVGDPVAKLRAAYAGADLMAAPHPYQEPPAEYLTAWTTRAPGDTRQPGDRGITYEINADGTVGSIRGGGPSIEYVEGCL